MKDEWLAPTPVRRVEALPGVVIEPSWVTELAPVRQLLTDGLDLSRTTVLVGENGTGKSTLAEAIAMAYGMNGEGGSTGATHTTWTSESGLHEWLRVVPGARCHAMGVLHPGRDDARAIHLPGPHAQRGVHPRPGVSPAEPW